MDIQIINGEVFEKLPQNHLDEEIARREDEIVRFEEALAKLKSDLADMRVKKEEQVVQLAEIIK